MTSNHCHATPENNYFHQGMRGIPPYQRIFADCIQRHIIDSTGALHGSTPVQLFNEVRDDFAAVIDCEAARWGDANNNPADAAGFSVTEWLPRAGEMRDTILASQLASIETQARDLGLWPGTQGPEIELYLPGMTVGVDEPILSPGGVVPFGTKIVLRAPWKTIQYFAEPTFPSNLDDPKTTSIGRQSAQSETQITLDSLFINEFSVKARTFNGLTGYSGLTEIYIFLQ